MVADGGGCRWCQRVLDLVTTGAKFSPVEMTEAGPSSVPATRTSRNIITNQ